MSHESRMIIGQHFPGKSFLHRTHPVLKILLLALHCLFIFQLKGIPATTIALLGLLPLFPLAGLPVRVLLLGIRPLAFLLFFTFGIHAFTTPGTLILGNDFFGITEEGLHLGAFHLLRIFCVILASSLLTATTPSSSITYGLERIFRPLKKVGFPTTEFALMLSISLRFIPVLMEEMEKLKMAQMSRGAHFHKGNLQKRAQAWMSLMVPLFHNALERADQMALAMEIRGFDPSKPRTSYRQHQLSGADLLSLGSWLAYAGLLLQLPIA